MIYNYEREYLGKQKSNSKFFNRVVLYINHERSTRNEGGRAGGRSIELKFRKHQRNKEVSKKEKKNYDSQNLDILSRIYDDEVRLKWRGKNKEKPQKALENAYKRYENRLFRAKKRKVFPPFVFPISLLHIPAYKEIPIK